MAVKEARRSGSDAATRSAEDVAGAAQLACVLEASAEKPGNITPSHDFADTTYEDMLRSAIALGPEVGRAAERGVGATVLAAVRATRRVAGSNTNLGIAREYATGYAITFDLGVPALHRALADGLAPRAATVELALQLLAAVPDTLIARKRGRAAAEEVSAGAAAVLDAG